ncbi:MAG TPA: MraY family glycosyltransferase [Gemmataceae bacterium]|nr:MraY family glycosyltransferase [Gemmataceae bacterium]
MNAADWLAALAWLFGVPLAISWLLTALLIRWAPLLGLVDHPNERKVHTRPTPRAGGLAIFAATTLTLPSIFNFQFSIFNFQRWLAAAVVLLGWLDDLYSLRWQIRLAVQFAVANLAVFFCLPPLPWYFRAMAVFWIAGHINAFNMLDNMDALSGGVAWIASGFLAVVPWMTSTPTVAEWRTYVILMGALSGFLWFNRPPARIFMGDAGSTFLGFTLGLGSVQAVLRDGAPSWSWLVPPCMLAAPCYDLLSVVLIRLSQGRSPFHADKQHLSHRLASRGLSRWTAVRVIYLLALASGTSGLILYGVRDEITAGLVAGQLAGWWITLAVIEFVSKEPGHDTQAANHESTGR